MTEKIKRNYSVMPKVLGFHTPSDGLTKDEKEIQRLIGGMAIESLYAKLPTSRMKAIVAMHFELGYSQEIIASVFGVDQSRIGHEIRIIKKIFLDKGTEKYNPYKAKKPKEVTIPELIRMLMMLQDQQ